MKRLLLPTVLIAAMMVFAACEQNDDSAATATSDTASPTSTPVPQATATIVQTATATSTVTPSPSPTATLQQHPILRVDTFVCERFFPGVPNPDGPNEWLNANGTITNAGELDIEFSFEGLPVVIEVLSLDGEIVASPQPLLPGSLLPVGQTMRFDTEPINAEHPSASSCTVKFNLADAQQELTVRGKTEVEVSIFAAP